MRVHLYPTAARTRVPGTLGWRHGLVERRRPHAQLRLRAPPAAGSSPTARAAAAESLRNHQGDPDHDKDSHSFTL